MASEKDVGACAADWLARLDRAELPAGEHALFDAWCRADKRHLAAYLRLLNVWNRLDVLAAPAGAATDSPRKIR